MASYRSVTEVSCDITGNRDILTLFFYREPFSYRHDALLYIVSYAKCNSRDERVQ